MTDVLLWLLLLSLIFGGPHTTIDAILCIMLMYVLLQDKGE